jgi:hypothetical protein
MHCNHNCPGQLDSDIILIDTIEAVVRPFDEVIRLRFFWKFPAGNLAQWLNQECARTTGRVNDFVFGCNLHGHDGWPHDAQRRQVLTLAALQCRRPEYLKRFRQQVDMVTDNLKWRELRCNRRNCLVAQKQALAIRRVENTRFLFGKILFEKLPNLWTSPFLVESHFLRLVVGVEGCFECGGASVAKARVPPLRVLEAFYVKANGVGCLLA